MPMNTSGLSFGRFPHSLNGPAEGELNGRTRLLHVSPLSWSYSVNCPILAQFGKLPLGGTTQARTQKWALSRWEPDSTPKKGCVHPPCLPYLGKETGSSSSGLCEESSAEGQWEDQRQPPHHRHPLPLCIWQQRWGTDHFPTLPLSEGLFNVALSLLLIKLHTDFTASSFPGTGKRGLSLWLNWTSVPTSLSFAH